MGFSDVVTTPDGSVGFRGNVRGADERGHDMLWIDLPGRPRLYGEYRQKFAENRNDFDFEIVSFGLTSPWNAGIPQPGRLRLSAMERTAAERLIRTLLCAPEAAQARNGMHVFVSMKGVFLGGVEFRPGWVLEEGPSAVGFAR